MGSKKMDVTTDGYSTVIPYAHMFETCPSMPPHYLRPKDCWFLKKFNKFDSILWLYNKFSIQTLCFWVLGWIQYIESILNFHN